MRLQFAADGRWEQAWVVPRGVVTATVDAWLAGTGEDVAFELFLTGTDGRSVFLGARLAALPAEERRARLLQTLRWLAYPPSSLAEAVDRCRELLGSTCFTGGPALIEASVIDAWKSAGPLRLWSAGDPAPTPALADRLRHTPLWQGEHPLPFGIEFAWTSPLPHWFGIDVSMPSAHGTSPDWHQVERALHHDFAGQCMAPSRS